jgi:Flp pilus assembly protein TadD
MMLKNVTMDSVTANFASPPRNIPEYIFVMFQGMFAIITPALILGAVVERMKFSSFLVFISAWLLIVYCPLAYMVWGGGWIFDAGAIDFAGGLVVHMSSGYSALVAGLLAFSGRTFLRNAIWADPVNLWREAVDKAPTDPLPRIVLGEVLHGAGRHPEAAASLQAALKLEPNEPLTYFKLSMCLTESGRSAEATAALDKLRSIHPQSIMVPTGLGVVALMSGDPERARDYFNQTLETDPRNVLALQWLAVLEEGHGAPAEALRRCEEVQQIQAGKSNQDCIRRNRLRLATEKADRR